MLNKQQTGLIYGLTAYFLWGFFPIFFYYLSAVSPTETLAQRIVWSFLFVVILILATGKKDSIKQALKNSATCKALLLSSVLIAVNWLAFIWAVANERVLESSFGYFLTPLVSVLLARVFLNETLDRYRVIACTLAAIGIGVQVINLGGLPWISLIVACSFGLYGLVRKQAAVESLPGLTIETAFMLPIAISYIVWLAVTGQSDFLGHGLSTSLLLVASGFVTAFPLLLFAAATKKLSLSVIGFMMYINPFIQMLCGIFFFGEPFDQVQLISFGFIWLGLFVFSAGAIAQQRRLRMMSNPVQ